MRDRKDSAKLPAAFTVEAAMLMPLILGILVLVLILGFYLHDKACMQGAACECAAMGSNLVTYEDQSAVVSQLGSTLLSHRLMWSRGITGSVSAGKTSAAASFTGTFSVPGIIGQLWMRGADQGTVRGSWSRQIYEPAKVIRKIRGARYLIETARGGSEE